MVETYALDPSIDFNFNLDPFENFKLHMKKAESAIKKDPNAMQLASHNKDGDVSIRTVLYKSLHDTAEQKGLTFYTHYNSQKGLELSQFKKAATIFYWRELDTQVRFEGVVEKVSRQDSQDYYATRPLLSRIGAWASKQSEVLKDRKTFLERVEQFKKEFAKKPLDCPENWGGFVLIPKTIEFWFAEEGRLHHRFIYQRDDIKSTDWKRFLKYP